ncbi:hypothetical protein AB1Y20_014204 [Prymnesium parvum]|uniref:Autophagy-related protein 9 n=1 Tax=Prymnesium parvum TaxID=97485 RepID=A0AB34ID25_PRYPA
MATNYMPAGREERLLEIDPALLQDGPREQWEAISDLDSFFTRVYAYFNEKGLQCILLSRIISLFMLAFTICFPVFFFAFVNLDELLNKCFDDVSCNKVSLLRPISAVHPSQFVVLYFCVFSLYWLWTLLDFLWSLRPLLEMRAFFRDKLCIDDSELQILSWDDIVQRIVELQRTSRLCIVKDQLTAHDIANRILRKENFMVAIVNRNLLPFRPHPCLPINLLSKTLEWNIYVCVFNPMFDRQFCIRHSFMHDVRGLQRRFIFYGVVNLVLAPFVAAFQLFFFWFKHAEEWYRRPASSALSRDFSLYARWTMQEFNELPHVFEARMQAAHSDATAYIKQFPTPLATLVAIFVSFIVSSLAAVLLVLSVLNENILLFYRFPHEEIVGAVGTNRLGGFNLLWWLAMFSTILAISRSFTSEGAYPLLKQQPRLLLESLSGHTHYMPEHWRGQEHTRHVYHEFRQLYQYRATLLLHEILGCVTAPLALIFMMPSRAAEILEFIHRFTAFSEGVGHVCSFALFDFERHGDKRYGAPAGGVPDEQSCLGKMEKAYVSFRIHHPSWLDSRGEALLDNIVGPGGAEATQRAAVAASKSLDTVMEDTRAAVLAAGAAVGADAFERQATLGAAATYKVCGVAAGRAALDSGWAEGTGTSSVGGAAETSGLGVLGGAHVDGRSTLGGGALGGLGGASHIGTSALGLSSLAASQLLLLSRSSQLLALAPHLGQSTLAVSHAQAASLMAGATRSSSERSEQLAAVLYERMEQFYRSTTSRSEHVESGAEHRVGYAQGAPVDAGNYELTTLET